MATIQSQSESKVQPKFTVSTSAANESVNGGVPAMGRGQCLCSPTTHEGSFRCRFHRSSATGTGYSFSTPRSKSMAADKDGVSV
ncbi:hypothetical protein HN51_035825 [Arachis hypogaea]|uniref:Serine-rich protein n=1 Tax=Arachis hypogaea TaxID=3818 RepID=A0A445A316_ARAHY|nr:uncharacterized protein DS421_13g411430 [Arachis hypogaea]RYR20755.1 hypothetical protein Ahy_B03g065984 [Arachis hypogaea]